MITSLPCSKPSTISCPMLADRNPNHSENEFKPALSMPASMEDMVYDSMPMGVESSVPLSGTSINMFLGHGIANGDPYSTWNQMQPGTSSSYDAFSASYSLNTHATKC
ncbi:hypothetical protein DITRI_Ditri16bG0010600 [Diplodiscus trichospermus]